MIVKTGSRLNGYSIEGSPVAPPDFDEHIWSHSQETPTILINHDYCKKCGICIAVCPEDIYMAGPDGGPVVAQAEQCIWCEKCEIYCPDFAIALRGQKAW